jgi:hypothetical protein
MLAVLALTVAPGAPARAAEVWNPAAVALSTPWTALVGPDNALPEYPRPQLVRTRWVNLNGLWDYSGKATAAGELSDTPEQEAYPEQILVPYPVESALSGIGRHDDLMWYRRVVGLPRAWRDQRVLLHFGAVDQKATVWVNDQQVAQHRGGYTSFSADITDALLWNGAEEITVRAEDRNEIGPFPVGKQRNDPAGLFYTGASGIWQTVWIEPVPAAHIGKLDITPALDRLTVTAQTSGTSDERVVVFVSRPGGAVVAIASGAPGEDIEATIGDPRLWSPDDPYLYDLRVALVDASGAVVDVVSSYAGLRTIGTVADSRGRPRIALNGEITFLHGPLDQGYWPDGIYTAPTDEALRSDLERTKELGMNFVRKHAKVEPARWYHWADRLGLLVWQDMPSLDVSLNYPRTPDPDPVAVAKANFEAELVAMIDQLRSVTAIVGWVPFNEGWGEFDTARIADLVKAADPSRMVNANSGVNCCKSRPDTGAGDVYDDHTYVGPGRPPPATTGLHLARGGSGTDFRVRVNGEYGGLGLATGALWPGRPESYEMTADPAELTGRYLELSRTLQGIIGEIGLSGAVYTQITDVENEVNGFLSYDRQVMKMPIPVVAERNRAVIAEGSKP